MKIDTQELSCDRCKRVVGIYAVNGEDHLMFFKCSDCINDSKN